MCVTAIIAVLMVALLSLLCGCKARKVVTEYVAVHDTLVVRHSDTIRDFRVVRDTIVDWKVLATHDTIHHEIERVLTLNERGDTISQREWERLWQKIHEMEQARHDESHAEDVAYYKSTADLLKAMQEKEAKKDVTKIHVPWKLLCFILVSILAVFMVIIRDKK